MEATVPSNPVINHTPPNTRHVYLTWQHDPSRTITFNVHGINLPSEITVYYDTKPHGRQLSSYSFFKRGEEITSLSLPDGRKLYQIELTALSPGTSYYCMIGDRFRTYGKEISFRTIPEKGTLVFVEGGDWENTPQAQKVAEQAAKCNPVAVLLGGDYPSQVFGTADFEKWDIWLDTYTEKMVTEQGHLIPMVMAIGNHEVIGGFGQTKEQAPFFFHYFCQGDTQKSYFSLPFGERVRVFVLDSGHTSLHDGEQLEWLANELACSDHFPIKMALYHVPLFPSIRFSKKNMFYRVAFGLVSCIKDRPAALKLYSKESALGRKYWLPLFDQYELTVAFEHHDQALKRTKCLRFRKEDPFGTVYLGDGGWGSEYQYAPIQGYFHQYFSALQGKKHFFWKVVVEEDRITYEAISALGNVIDRFCQPLKKRGSGRGGLI